MFVLLNLFYLIFGCAALYYGADFLVAGGASLAKKIGISSLVIGLTLVACATSMPELVVSASAAIDGTADISLGNIVGSNLCNIALILGICGCITPVLVDKRVFFRDTPVMLLATALLFGFYFMNHGLQRWQAAIFLVVFAAYLTFTLRQEMKSPASEGEDYKVFPLWKSLLLVVLGLCALLVGARTFLWGSVYFAKLMHISDAVIGLTVVAVGTSLPELATSVVAAIKGENDIAIGNVVGSNIFNILFILGVTPLIRPLAGCSISVVDMSAMSLVSVLLFIFMRTGWKVSRIEGVCLLGLYIAYTAYLVVQCC